MSNDFPPYFHLLKTQIPFKYERWDLCDILIAVICHKVKLQNQNQIFCDENALKGDKLS